MLNPTFLKNRSETHSCEDNGVYTFLKGICPKANVIARLEFDLDYFNSAVQRLNHYTILLIANTKY